MFKSDLIEENGLFNYLKIKYKIWRFKIINGKYKAKPLTQEEYENFFVPENKLHLLKRINKTNVVIEQFIDNDYPVIRFPFETKK